MRLQAEDGQVLGLTTLLLGVLVGVAALVADVGVWLRADRRLQSAVDAAGLAGAQALPDDASAAVSVAVEYARRNGASVRPEDVWVESHLEARDTLAVRAASRAPGLFSRLFGIASVEVGADAAVRLAKALTVRGAAPFLVSDRHPLLQCVPTPCFDAPAVLPLADLAGGPAAAGSFGLVDLGTPDGGSAGTTELAAWVREGFGGLLGPGRYGAAPGSAFNADAVRDAVASRIGDELLLPVYRSVTGSGAQARFEVVAWVGFLLEGFTASGNGGTLEGRFTRTTVDGVPVDGPVAGRDLGVRTLELVR